MVVEIKHSYSYGGVSTPSRAKLMDLEAVIADMPGAIGWEEAEETLNTHHFAPGVYGRTIIIPKGMCVVGKIHIHAHMNIITYGHVKVVTEFGEDEFTGSRIWVSEPGTKRAVIALADTEWTTIHANPKEHRDIRDLEREIIAPDFDTFDRLAIEQGNIL